MKKNEIVLTDHLRSWIYNKIQGHYRRELYFQGLDISFYFSTFKLSLLQSNNFKELESNLKEYGINNCLSFVRKETENNSFLKFDYPSLSFQAESLFYCWNEILKIQKDSNEDISKAINYQRDLKFIEDEDKNEIEEGFLDKKRSCYGNKPNLSVTLESNLDESIQKEEERKVFPLSTDFKYEYNSFRHSVITKSKSIIEQNQNVIFIQTDIKTFFHNLQIEPLADFIDKKFSNSKNLCKYLRLLKTKFQYDTLPIGWVLSRFVANIIIQEVHSLFNEKLSKEFKNNFKEQSSNPTSNNIASNKVELKNIISYVDDFIFLLSVPTDIEDISDIVIKSLLQEANKLLNKVLKNNKTLEFHGIDTNKTKYHLFNKNNISSLKSNFSFFDTADDYLLGDSEITARVDEILLPVDNDITLNANQQFHRHLKGLQKIVIGDHNFKEEKVKDLLGQIQIKIEKTGSRYIKSVFRLFYFLELSSKLPPEVKTQIKTEIIKSIFKKMEQTNNFSFEWIKFFNGYFNFLHATEYKNTDQFFSLLDKCFHLMKKYTTDDKMLFRLLKCEYTYKIILNTSGKKEFKEELLDNLKETESNTLLSLFNQRNRAIDFLKKIIQNKNNSINEPLVLKPIDLIWISVVLNQLLLRKVNIQASQLFSIIEAFQGEESNIFHFGLSRIATVYLPLNTKENQYYFIDKVRQYKNNPFWQITCELIDHQKQIADHYKFNEKKRLKQVFKRLKDSDFFTKENEKNKDIIWQFIEKSFSTKQNKICAYFVANRFNNESEFLKYILTSQLNIEASLLTSWSALPLTFQKTGIHTNIIIKKLFEMNYNEGVKDSEFNFIKDYIKTALDKVKIQKLDKFIDQKYFGVNLVNLDLLPKEFEDQKIKKKLFKITIAPLHLKPEYIELNNGFRFKAEIEKLIDLQVRGAINEAIKQKSSILIFPEMSIPRSYLQSYLRLASGHHIVLVGGMEYYTDIRKQAYNSAIVSIPVKRSLNPGGRGYFAFEQLKNFPASVESYYLSKNNYKYIKKGSGVFIFKSQFWGDFAVLTCSDFLSLGLRWILQGEVQTVFVPAQNKDSITYDHISETSIRDLHCLTIVCNNPEKGSSHCYAPYYKHYKRQVFKKIGISKPEYHTFDIDPKEFKKHNRKLILKNLFVILKMKMIQNIHI